MKQYIYEYVCEKCGKKFSKSYNASSSYVKKYCNDCSAYVKKELGMKYNPSTDNEVNSKMFIEKLKTFIINYYNDNNTTPTFVTSCCLMKISSKTVCKYFRATNTSYSIILEQLSVSNSVVVNGGLSIFQKTTLGILHDIFPDVQIISEKMFDDLINPKTGCNLRIDIYLPAIKLAIECDGKQHYEDEHYYNKLANNKGYTSCKERDYIKTTYCINNGIRLIRVPYKKNVSKKYIQQFLIS